MPLSSPNSLPTAQGQPRVDGCLKVTGQARYAAEFTLPGLAYGSLVQSTISAGRVLAIDTAAAEAVPGVLGILTQSNMPRLSPPPARSHRQRPTRRILRAAARRRDSLERPASRRRGGRNPRSRPTRRQPRRHPIRGKQTGARSERSPRRRDHAEALGGPRKTPGHPGQGRQSARTGASHVRSDLPDGGDESQPDGAGQHDGLLGGTRPPAPPRHDPLDQRHPAHPRPRFRPETGRRARSCAVHRGRIRLEGFPVAAHHARRCRRAVGATARAAGVHPARDVHHRRTPRRHRCKTTRSAPPGTDDSARCATRR